MRVALKGPRRGHDGKVLSRTILGDPDEFEEMNAGPGHANTLSHVPSHAGGIHGASRSSQMSRTSVGSRESSHKLSETEKAKRTRTYHAETEEKVCTELAYWHWLKFILVV
jgi:hypothetical protein